MKRRKTPDEEQGKLEPQLQRTLDEVGREHYAKATAKDFAPGGKFAQRPRRARTALT